MKVIWPESARADMRRIDREVAIRILHALTAYGESGTGDIKALTGNGKATFAFESAITASYSQSQLMKLRSSAFAIGPKRIDNLRPPALQLREQRD